MNSRKDKLFSPESYLKFSRMYIDIKERRFHFKIEKCDRISALRYKRTESLTNCGNNNIAPDRTTVKNKILNIVNDLISNEVCNKEEIDIVIKNELDFINNEINYELTNEDYSAIERM